ncbi:acyl carrier protein [Microbacterium rhizosphaerae]|uniref:Phosphopantetheine-binding protein n=1 Tax=Microbacterium rhizosphaerae TaxID=1678237 RepID=A0ABZ0SKF0_9MICO|nr:phosphopantetheine-binding protein [Microbacterium rhizosphaerae]WPR88293.1 phosphopantetheine-binding protein [Microbacterium rhizosphaerae]
MNEQDARAAVLAAITDVAPDIDVDGLDESARLRQDLELDSLDFLGILERLAASTGVTTPEEDYGALTTVQALTGYIASRA